MPVKIRLARRGRRKKPYYHIIVADSRASRDGRFIEQIGSYNPMTKPATIDLDRDKALEWLMKGAQPTDTARAILRFKGVLYRRHLLRGVKKGALTQEDADKLYNDYIESKESKVAERFEEARKEKEAFWLAVSGTTAQKAPDLTRDDEALSAFQEETKVDSVEAAEADAEATEQEASVEEVAQPDEPATENEPEAQPSAESSKAEAVVEEPEVETPSEESPKEGPEEVTASSEEVESAQEEE